MYTHLLRKGSFLFLWLAQIASTLAVQLYKVSVIVVIFDQTGSALQAAGVLVATSLPYVILGQVAGALVDRYPRKAVMIAAAVAQAALVGASIYLIGGDALNVWVAYLVVAGLSVVDAFYKPALLASIPAVVEPPQIVHANSLINSTNYAVMGLGYGLGGLLIVRVGLPVIVAINLVLFVVAALLVMRVSFARPPHATATHATPDPLWRSIGEGLAYLRNHDWPAVSILAHEIGHHLAGHTLSEVYNRDFELEADYFSGFILQKMGATLDEAQTVMSLLRDHPNMTDHPPQAERLAVIEQGWQDAARQQGLVWEPNFSTFIEEGAPAIEANAATPTAIEANVATPTTTNVIGVLAQARDNQLARQQAEAALAVRDWGVGLRALAD